MCHICTLIQLPSDAQVSYLDCVILCQEHVDCLDVTVQDSVDVQVLDSKTHLNEEAPNLLFWQVSPHLLLKKNSQITVLAKLHDYVKFVLILERIHKFDNILVPQFVHQQSFAQRLLALGPAHPAEINLLEDVDLPVLLPPDFINDAEGALPQLIQFLEVSQLTHLTLCNFNFISKQFKSCKRNVGF